MCMSSHNNFSKYIYAEYGYWILGILKNPLGTYIKDIQLEVRLFDTRYVL